MVFGMSRVERLGIVEWLPVHKRSRTLYLKLRSEDVAMYDIRSDDLVLVHLRVVKKTVREEEDMASDDGLTRAKDLTLTELRVLEFIGDGAKTATDITEFMKMSREHSARLLKSLYERGFLTRDAATSPYRYRVKAGKK